MSRRKLPPATCKSGILLKTMFVLNSQVVVLTAWPCYLKRIKTYLWCEDLACHIVDVWKEFNFCKQCNCNTTYEEASRIDHLIHIETEFFNDLGVQLSECKQAKNERYEYFVHLCVNKITLINMKSCNPKSNKIIFYKINIKVKANNRKFNKIIFS